MFTRDGAIAAARALIEKSSDEHGYIGLGTGTVDNPAEVAMGTTTNYARVKCNWSTSTSNTDTEANIGLDTNFGTGGVLEGTDSTTGLPYISVKLRNYNTFMFNDADNPFAAQGTSVWGTITVVCLYSAATGGNLLYAGELATSFQVNQGDRPRFSTITQDHPNPAFTIELKFQQVQ